MIRNLKTLQIPQALISEFFPVQYRKIRNGMLEGDPEILIKDRIANIIDDYLYAVTP
jgi:D-tagatose-1,6-bisphosphate aldolase subunit GatZ/KbaZ